MAKREDITPELLRQLLYCDFEKGKLYWYIKPSGKIERESRLKTWNSRYSNHEAFTTKDDKGYFVGRIFKLPFKAHRVIWALYHGEWPQNEIDHINRNKADNRISNLRDVTSSQNNQNKSLKSSNKTGVSGVYWDEARSKWRATIGIEGKQIYLGRFAAFDKAARVRILTERDLFSINRGEQL